MWWTACSFTDNKPCEFTHLLHERQGLRYSHSTMSFTNWARTDVDVKVSHCGICHSDVHLIDNDWGISHYPLVPGHEIVGTVAATGEAVEQLNIGERVGVGWQSGSCLRCEWCLNGYENLCRSKVLTCVRRHGGFADFVRTDSRFTFSIPESLGSAGAAPLLCAGVTVYAPMRRYGVRPHHHVGVIGIGGLGHLALQFAHAMGCEVTAFSTNPEKKDDAAAFGADHFVMSRDPSQMRNAAQTLDFILSTATAPLPWTAYVEALRPNGTLTIVSRLSSEAEAGVVKRTCFASRCRPKIDRRERNRRESGHARDAHVCRTSRHRRKNRGILLCRHKQRCATCAQQRRTLSSRVRDLTYPKVLIETRRLPRSKMKLNKFNALVAVTEICKNFRRIPAARVLVESERRI